MFARKQDIRGTIYSQTPLRKWVSITLIPGKNTLTSVSMKLVIWGDKLT